MKQIYKIMSFMVLALIASTNVFAYDVAVENANGVKIYYNYISDGKELEVTFYDENNNYDAYKGNVNIPTEVTYMNRTRRVTSIGNRAFCLCGELKSVTIPNSVTTIEELAFWECYNLTSISIGSGVTKIGSDAFEGCDDLEKVIVKDIAAWCGIEFEFSFSCSSNPLFKAAHIFSDENTEITNLVIPNSVTTIGELAFFGCSGLTSVSIGNSVTTIGELSFSGCSGMTSLSISNSVTTIGSYAFEECSGLTFVNIPNSVTTIGEAAFIGCIGMTSVSIGNGVKSIGERAFACEYLEKVIVKDIAAYCGIRFEDSYSNPLYFAAHIYSDENTEIKNLVIPNSVTTIGEKTFSGCSGLTSVTIPNSVTTIGDEAFANCSSLASMTIPNSVTAIGSYAFSECSGLTSVTIPNSVTTIGDKAFSGCNNLAEIVSLIEKPFSISSSVFSNNTLNNATLYVPIGTLDVYNSTNGWKSFVWIEEKSQTGISAAKTGDSKPTVRYNLDGQRITESKKGINIIQMSDGATKKVLVK